MAGEAGADVIAALPRASSALRHDWTLCRTAAGAAASPADLAAARWIPAIVPGTVAAALRAAGDQAWSDPRLERDDWWYRCAFTHSGTEPALLVLDGLATHADVWLNGVPLLHSTSMFARHRLDVGSHLREGHNELTIRFAALTPVLGARHARGRWRARLVENQSLRWIRTSLLGRTPGWGWTPPIVGPWRPIELRRADRPVIRDHTLDAACEGDGGTITVRARVMSAVPITGSRLVVDGVEFPAEVEPLVDGAVVRATVRFASVERWWPHTHGTARLYEVGILLAGEAPSALPLGRVGFRTVELEGADGGFALRVNGEPVFCRGGVWMPLDAVSLQAGADAYTAALMQLRGAGMNMLRVSGVTVYEQDVFHELCDELGILVWQDLMFSTLDYPADDPGFAALARSEAETLAAALGQHPSTALICGNNEVQQQAAMLGLPPAEWRSKLFDELFAESVAEHAPRVPYWASSPSGGTMPFQPSSGDAHYFGYGAFLREHSDVRTADVRFASECLALSHVPEPAMVGMLPCGPAGAGHHPEWKRGIPRDGGASWDFEDVRDHYLERIFELDPRVVRRADPERYLALGRLVSVELVERTLAEWRRQGSRCAGALAWTLRDLVPGAGWGLIDARGCPKAAFHAFARLSRPLALFAVDEGLNGLYWHIANDTSVAMDGLLTLDAIRNGAIVSSGSAPVSVVRRGVTRIATDGLFDRFTDVANAYRFGGAALDAIAATLMLDGVAIARSIHLPAGMREAAARTHTTLTAAVAPSGRGYAVEVRSSQLAVGVAIHAGDWIPDDNYFHLVPGEHRTVHLRPLNAPGRLLGRITALNATATCTISEP